MGEDRYRVICPFCGEESDIYIEPDVRGTFVQDCEVCCNPWRIHVEPARGRRRIEVRRGDGSE